MRIGALVFVLFAGGQVFALTGLSEAFDGKWSGSSVGKPLPSSLASRVDLTISCTESYVIDVNPSERTIFLQYDQADCSNSWARVKSSPGLLGATVKVDEHGNIVDTDESGSRIVGKITDKELRIFAHIIRPEKNGNKLGFLQRLNITLVNLPNEAPEFTIYHDNDFTGSLAKSEN